MATWFTSDNHFYHNNIIKMFGRKGIFQNLDEMHDYMIKQWNSVVAKSDTVYVIGDFSFGNVADTRTILCRLNGMKILIRGNHDERFSTHALLNAGFHDVRDSFLYKVGSGDQVRRILLCHYPYNMPAWKFWLKFLFRKLGAWRKHYVLYPAYRPNNWLIHGHIHGGDKIKGRAINVNVESWDYLPVSEETIIKIMDEVDEAK